MKTLALMRHAKSDWKQPGKRDHDRPLNARGRRAAPAMGRYLQSQGVEIDVILASSAERVRETVDLLQQNWASNAEVLRLPSLYLASPMEMLREIRALDDSWSSAMLVAHNPGLASLVSQLSGQSLSMPTAAVAVFDLTNDSWQTPLSANSCQLRHYCRPRDLEE